MIASTSAPPQRPDERAGVRAWIGLAVLALPALLASLELTVTHLALPAIGRDLEPTSTQLLWIVDVYAFLLAASLITMGTLGDRIGRRRLLMVGAAAYGAVSLLAAFSTSAEMLIATRAVQGVAGATLMPSTLALTAALFANPRQRTVAIGVIIASVAGGTAIGPLVGGWLLERYWWGSVFLLGVPVMALLLMVGPVLLPEPRTSGTRRVDLVSVAISLAAVLLLVHGLKQIASHGLGATAVVALVAGVAAAVGFLRRQRRLTDPLLDLTLFTSPAFSASLAIMATGIFVLWGANYLLAQYLQLVHGLTPLHAGLWTAPSALGVIAGSQLATRIVRWVRPGHIVGAGLAFAAVGFVVLSGLQPTSGLSTVLAGSVIVSTGLGPMMALTTDMVVGAAPPERAGAAAAISSTAPQLGGALGIAVLGSVLTAVYRAAMRTGVPADVPSGSARAAKDTLAGASAVADHLPGPLRASLLDAAGEAFTRGLHVTSVLSAVVLALGAGVTMISLRHVRAGARPDGGDNGRPGPVEAGGVGG